MLRPETSGRNRKASVGRRWIVRKPCRGRRSRRARPRPETWSRGGFPPEEVCKPDSVLPPRKREQQPFVWSPGCPGDRATDPRERTGSPRLASRPEPPSYTVLLRVGFTERPLSRADL